MTFNRSEIDAADAPAPELRDAMKIRGRELDACLTAGTIRTVTAAILEFLQAFAGGEGVDPGDAAGKVKAYLKALGTEPIWAVEQVLGEYATGKRGAHTFAPTPSVVAVAVKLLVDPYREERARIRRVLAAQVVTPKPPISEEKRAELVRWGLSVADSMREEPPEKRRPASLPEIARRMYPSATDDELQEIIDRQRSAS